MSVIANAIDNTLISIDSTFVIVIVALAIALARTREEVVKLKEWARIHELERGDKHG